MYVFVWNGGDLVALRDILYTRNIQEKEFDLVQNGDHGIAHAVLQIATQNTGINPVNKIYKAEEGLFIEGYEYTGLRGICETSTRRRFLKDAMKEFDPGIIITGSKYLAPEGVTMYRTERVSQYVSYLVPRSKMLDGKISPAIAEIAVAEDIKEGDLNDLHEWVAIEIHDHDAFVLVDRNMEEKV